MTSAADALLSCLSRSVNTSSSTFSCHLFYNSFSLTVVQC